MTLKVSDEVTSRASTLGTEAVSHCDLRRIAGTRIPRLWDPHKRQTSLEMSVDHD